MLLNSYNIEGNNKIYNYIFDVIWSSQKQLLEALLPTLSLKHN